MNAGTIILQHKRICNLVVRRKVKQSFDLMADMLGNVSVGGLRDEFGELRTTYLNILKYTVEGIHDPERHKIYLKLLQNTLRLNDRIKQDILARSLRMVHIFCQSQGTEGREIEGGKHNPECG